MKHYLFSFFLFIPIISCSEAPENKAIKASQKTPSQDYVWNLESGLAVSGYDPVAYFFLPSATANAVKGSKEFSYKWAGATWHFSSRENLEKFKAEPEKYIPQYGGYCAYAAARNYLYRIDPNAWTIKEGRLYLNASKGLRRTWLRNIDDEILKADKNWPGLKESAKAGN